MAKYKTIDKNNMLIPVSFEDQLIPGTFAHTINIIIDNLIDTACFDRFYHNDNAGAKAYNPKTLLKIILYAYSLGINYSRKIEYNCKYNIIFMALSGDTQPDHSTIAAFISEKSKHIVEVFKRVLLICSQLELIGGDKFAVDGCKTTSNAAKECSGTFKELKEKQRKLESVVNKLIEKHKQNDLEPAADLDNKLERLNNRIKKIDTFLRQQTPKMSSRGKENKSNTTDNDSGKMLSSKGYIQGYNGLALVDGQQQIIMHGEVIGQVNEGAALKDVIENGMNTAKQIGIKKKDFIKAKLLADTNYFSEANLQYLAKRGIDSYIPDQQARKRDPSFPEKNRYRKYKNLFSESDFTYDKQANRYSCPNGKQLKYEGTVTMHGHFGRRYRADKEECMYCHLKSKCLRKNSNRRCLFINDKPAKKTYSRKMMEKIDTKKGKEIYSHRLGIVEPVFANITFNKRLNRFTMRGKSKVKIQWYYYCLVHNLEKITKYGDLDKLKSLKIKKKRNTKIKS